MAEYTAQHLTQWLTSLQIGEQMRIEDDEQRARYGVRAMLARERGTEPSEQEVDELLVGVRAPYIVERIDERRRLIALRDSAGGIHEFNTVNGKLGRHGSGGLFSFAARIVPIDWNPDQQGALHTRVAALAATTRAAEQGIGLTADQRAAAQTALDELPSS